MIAARLEVLHTALAGLGATSDGLDPLGVIDTALTATPDGGTVIVLTSGFSTTSPIDLNAAGAWIAHPDPVGIWVFAGLGYPPAAQEPAAPAARKALTSIWIGVLRAAARRRARQPGRPA